MSDFKEIKTKNKNSGPVKRLFWDKPLTKTLKFFKH